MTIVITCSRDVDSDEADLLQPFVAVDGHFGIQLRSWSADLALRDVQGAVLVALSHWPRPPLQISFTLVTTPEKESTS
jgi:hypothetical protein